jgi:alpha-glucosidase
VLIGETPVPEIESLAAYYGTGTDELHLAFNFPFITAPLEPSPLRTIVESTEAALPPDGWPVWTGSNHDMSRLASRWAKGDAARARVALFLLLCLRGTPVLYQGDEIGLADTDVPQDQLRDPLGVAYWPAYAGRDAMRTPMHWRNAPGGGFTGPGGQPWLPFGDLAHCNVADQRSAPTSMLTLARDLIALRRDTPALQIGAYRSLPSSPGAWAWSRGDRIVVALNMTAEESVWDGVSGTVRLGSDRGRDGEPIDNTLRLRGWEAVVVERSG